MVWTRPPFPLVDSYFIDSSEIKDTFWKSHKKRCIGGTIFQNALFFTESVTETQGTYRVFRIVKKNNVVHHFLKVTIRGFMVRIIQKINFTQNCKSHKLTYKCCNHNSQMARASSPCLLVNASDSAQNSHLSNECTMYIAMRIKKNIISGRFLGNSSTSKPVTKFLGNFLGQALREAVL